MITSKDIKALLKNHITHGTSLSIGDIQDVIKKHYPLSACDKAPHTETRPTVYPVWKHRLQGVLSGMKSNGQITHNVNSHFYTF